ncbi:DNA mismatch repair endonuclease MutL [Candidatus Thorarchaeota archaeon]|nr:MAG: DNA mismatch repair endonuclease MutL [Candidatus Thorarchaeota archaeon]
MAKIRVLGDDLVSLISAGEVIENPSSVVKELIENSLDAGASRIDIEIENGGLSKIMVSDNGEGMAKEDLMVSILRHSTSKISNKSDIDEIATYGFRGEALASIAAVADIQILSSVSDSEVGGRLAARIGEKPIVTDAARPPGTTVLVQDLFARVPARKKHLGSPGHEGMRVYEVVMRHAAVRHDIGFRLVRDGESAIDVPPNQQWVDRVSEILGHDIGANLIPVDRDEGSLKIGGFVAKPPISRGNRSREFISVLNRPIEDERLSKAIEAAYSTLLMRGRYPVCVINISMDRGQVDANVHPTKREVRIADIDKIAGILRKGVRSVLNQEDIPESLGSPYLSEDAAIRHEKARSQLGENTMQPRVLVERQTLLDESLQKIEDEVMELGPLGGEFRIIGQAMNLYILLDVDDGILVVDQHAANERVMYERFRREVNSGSVGIQEMLEPILLQLNAADVEKILKIADDLSEIGYEISFFGGNEVLVSAVPEILGRSVSKEDMLALVDQILDIGSDHASEHFMDELVKITACHNAIRSGQALNNEEIRRLLVELARTKDRYYCPHGRPTLFKLTERELEKRFKRRV